MCTQAAAVPCVRVESLSANTGWQCAVAGVDLVNTAKKEKKEKKLSTQNRKGQIHASNWGTAEHATFISSRTVIISDRIARKLRLRRLIRLSPWHL